MYKVIAKTFMQRWWGYTAKTNILLHDVKRCCAENYDSCILLCKIGWITLVIKWIFFFKMRTIWSDEEWNIHNTVNPIKSSTHWNKKICEDP
jgi:hypothetical protein